MANYFLWNDETVSKVCTIISSGHLIISTTDTILGLLAPCTLSGFEQLNQIKGRQEKPYLVLAADVAMARSLVAESHHKRLEYIAYACWPGPVTCIFPAHSTVPSYMQSAQGAIAIRIPQHSGLLSVLQKTGPLFSTSANKAGQPVPHDMQDIDASLLEAVACVVSENESEVKPQSAASTILDCTHDEINVVRQGDFVLDEQRRKALSAIK